MEPGAFAHDWLEAWNAHDLARILSHYAEDVVLTSPRAREVFGEVSGAVYGKAALAEYFGRGLARRPDLRFTLCAVYDGVDSIVLRYHSYDGRDVSEMMIFDLQGLVREVRVHWKCDDADKC